MDREKLELLFDILEGCRGVVQMDIHHPEGDVFVHSLQVLKWALRESSDQELIVAAMMHDVGKIYDSKEHDKIAPDMLSQHLSEKTLWLIRNHMRFWYYIKGEMRKLSKVKELSENKWFAELAQLARWDKLGRNPNMVIEYDREKLIEEILKL